jgi:hypothetical protein
MELLLVPRIILYICGVMAEVDKFKKLYFLFSVDVSYLNGKRNFTGNQPGV